ncbi:NADP-dependent oxidoreductase domain-containing protein [Mycena metata]|uniref:NADP-dependent oxidoreductase domain-containing protein n=1 Tax=Mycena metata TaxID=1033252 RepID=A0AAD7N5X4_9AGAR|nr:NADP-dependent oxidoreductase domain-containing protein [Mycena metata]
MDPSHPQIAVAKQAKTEQEMTPIPSIKLNTGASIPAIGFGTGVSAYDSATLEASEKWTLTGLEAGYKHIDTAALYRTEPYVGKALRAAGVKREEMFITTKLPPHHQVYVERSFNDSLSNLGVDYVDLYLIHWPQNLAYPGGYEAPDTLVGLFTEFQVLATPTFNDTWAEFERLHASGRARAIGVSNFSIKTLEELFTTAKIVPAVNQIEIHPYLVQTELVEYCQKKGIVVEAYTPTGREVVRDDPVIVALAAKYKATTTQVILAWHLARGIVAIPGSTNVERQKQNLDLPTLSAEDVASITALDRGQRVLARLMPDNTLIGWSAERLGWEKNKE